MSTEHYIGDELSLFARAHNWKKYWSQRLAPIVEGPVLEVGAGIGSNLTLLRQHQQEWLALEPDVSQADQIRAQHAPADATVSVKTGVLDDISDAQRFKTILYIDVLEHIEHDREEVKKAFSKLQGGGRLVILSPAHQRLYSPFDKAVGHFRRYNKEMLKALTPDQADVEIESLYYLDSVGCLASLANALLLKSSMPTPKQIGIWDSLMVPVSKILDRLLAYSVGKTIVIVWRKREH